MKGKPFQITTVFFFIMSLFIGNTVNATTWFVRPSGEEYGLGDGTSGDFKGGILSGKMTLLK